MLMTFDIKDQYEESYTLYITELGEVDSTQLIAHLADQAVMHALTKEDEFSKPLELTAFTFKDQYSAEIFHGIMPDTGAARVSTASRLQYLALQKLDPTVKLDTSNKGAHSIQFRKGELARTEGTIQVNTPLGNITFHVVPTNTPFLLYIQDIDHINVKLDNLANVLIQGPLHVPIIHK
jgi:hypothetical protein